MNDKLINEYPTYKTRSEVLTAAHENKSFYEMVGEGFRESLINSWKFYQK